MQGPNGAFGGSKTWKMVSSEQQSWYDVTTYHVPYRGTYNHGAIHKRLNAHVGSASASLGKFGGWTSYEIGPDNGDGTFTLKSYYHIGD